MQSRELVKLYYRIGEVSEIVGVQPHVLRYWETEFRSIRPQKSSKGQRVYSRRDVEKLLRVKDLLRNQGFTIAGARKRLSDPADAVAPPATPSLAPASVAPAVSLVAVTSAGASGAAPPAAKAPPAAATPVPCALAAVSAPRSLVIATPTVAVEESFAARALAQGTAERSTTRGAAERGAKDMRRALLGLRQDLMRMLGEIDATRARERGEH
jgi:DNA-binding transcriptional MerR regulator